MSIEPLVPHPDRIRGIPQNYSISAGVCWRMTIQLADPTLGDAELDQIAAVFKRGRLTRGPEVEAFETEFVSYCDAAYGIATSNGTTALHTALTALDLGLGDRIATPSFSFIPSANAIRWCGAEPTFLDSREDTYTIDVRALESRLRDGEQIDAVVTVHLFGLPCEMGYLQELADEYDFLIIEDAAQAHGATYNGTPVGSLGDVACFSFFATKNMTTGEGGMVLTNRSDVAESARQFIEHGNTDQGYEGLGHNFCMSDITAAIGRVQLEKLPDVTDARRENANHFSTGLCDVPVVTPSEPDGRKHVYHLYTIQTDHRDELWTHLSAEGIQTGIYYDTPIHEQPAYSSYDVVLPTVDSLKERVLSIPIHPGLSIDDRERIIDAVHEFFEDM